MVTAGPKRSATGVLSEFMTEAARFSAAGSETGPLTISRN